MLTRAPLQAGETPLVIASITGQVDVVKMLLASHADVNATNQATVCHSIL